MDRLAVDIAAGDGEALNAVAEISELDASRKTQLFSALQNNFDKIYASPDVTHQTVFTNIVQIIETI